MRTLIAFAAAIGLTLIFSADVAQAQGLVGKEAPPINAKEWINTEGDLTLKDLEGSIVFIEFTSTR